MENKDKEELKTGFNCPECDRTFVSKTNLTRHCNEVHSKQDIESLTNVCPVCNESFTRCNNLTRHFNTKHKGEPGTCLKCKTTFPTVEALFKHNKEVHINIEDKKPAPNNSIQCTVCDKTFSCKQNLNKHMKNVYTVKNDKSPSILCPLCEEKFNTVLILEKHLAGAHNLELELEEIIFDSIEDFQAWKLNIEREDLAFFFKKSTTEDKVYYECHRSGSVKSNGTGQKLKWSHSNKLGKCCPARIITSKLVEKVKVCVQRSHVGHTQSIRFLHLTKDDRDEIAGKLKSGVTFDRILDDIRESVASEKDLKRIHVIDKRDLHNIVKCYNLDRDIADKNDALSTEMWVQEQQLLGDDSPVLYFKMQGCDDGGPLLVQDFMIVIMTPYQRDVIVKYTNEKVAIDSTHKATDHDFQLTTQLTVDEFGAMVVLLLFALVIE